MIFQKHNVKRIAKIDEYLANVIIARPDFRERSDVVKNIYWQREWKKGDVLLNGTP